MQDVFFSEEYVLQEKQAWKAGYVGGRSYRKHRGRRDRLGQVPTVSVPASSQPSPQPIFRKTGRVDSSSEKHRQAPPRQPASHHAMPPCQPHAMPCHTPSPPQPFPMLPFFILGILPISIHMFSKGQMPIIIYVKCQKVCLFSKLCHFEKR